MPAAVAYVPPRSELACTCSRCLLRRAQVTVGKLYMVDLAGSERLKKSKSVGLRATEARSINLSLTMLGMCIQVGPQGGEGEGCRVEIGMFGHKARKTLAAVPVRYLTSRTTALFPTLRWCSGLEFLFTYTRTWL